MDTSADDNEQEIIVFREPIPPCRVPIRRPDGSLVLVSCCMGVAAVG